MEKEKEETFAAGQDPCEPGVTSQHSPSDSDQPQRSGTITSDEEEISSALDVGSESSHYEEEEEALNILPENQNDNEEEKGKQPVSPRSTLYPFEEQQVRLAPDEGGVLHRECDKHPNDVSRRPHNPCTLSFRAG
ncbi:putative neuroblastoma breakpoint family member 5 [Plecturocebus cupreus]